jgi:hypothetical protein
MAATTTAAVANKQTKIWKGALLIERLKKLPRGEGRLRNSMSLRMSES